MYLGKLMEVGDALEVLERGSHPYTRALLSAVPVPEPGRKRGRIVLPGEIPSALEPPSGCRFRTRCPWAQERCAQEEPLLREVRKTRAACHFAESIVQEVSA
jgi:oligopeptide/dipeptide ABC transporter ATP-binding protein